MIVFTLSSNRKRKKEKKRLECNVQFYIVHPQPLVMWRVCWCWLLSWVVGAVLRQPLGLYRSIVVHVNPEGHCRRGHGLGVMGRGHGLLWPLRSVPSMAENQDCALCSVIYHVRCWSWSAAAIKEELLCTAKNLDHYFYYLSFQGCVFEGSGVPLRSEWSCRKVETIDALHSCREFQWTSVVVCVWRSKQTGIRLYYYWSWQFG